MAGMAANIDTIPIPAELVAATGHHLADDIDLSDDKLNDTDQRT